MLFSEHLNKEDIRKFNQLRKAAMGKKKISKKKKGERLTKKDLDELMGVNRDIYQRRNGAIRRK